MIEVTARPSNTGKKIEISMRLLVKIIEIAKPMKATAWICLTIEKD